VWGGGGHFQGTKNQELAVELAVGKATDNEPICDMVP
jgi:hypothetical protein